MGLCVDFARQIVARMVVQPPGATDPTVTLPPGTLADRGPVPDEARVLCAQVGEHLRAALDYSIVKIAEKANPDLTRAQRRSLKFIIASNPEGFEKAQRTLKRHVGDEAVRWMEALQPYHGNELMGFIGNLSIFTKHNSLSKIRHVKKLFIVFGKDDAEWSTWERHGWWIFPIDEDSVFRVRLESIDLLIQDGHKERNNAAGVLTTCIGHVRAILNTVELYLQNEDCLLLPQNHDLRHLMDTE